MPSIKTEPVVAAAVVNAAVALLAIYGFRISAGVVGIVVPVLSIALGFLARSRVTPVPPAPPAEHAAP